MIGLGRRAFLKVRWLGRGSDRRLGLRGVTGAPLVGRHANPNGLNVVAAAFPRDLAALALDRMAHADQSTDRRGRSFRVIHHPAPSTRPTPNHGARTPSAVTTAFTVSTSAFQPLMIPPMNPSGSTSPARSRWVNMMWMDDSET